MKGTIISLVVLTSMFIVGAAPNTQAQRNQECSNASLQGAYGFHLGGFRVPAGTPFEVLGRTSFDGRGNFTNTATANDNGIVMHQQGSGTYTVNADCTGTLFPRGGGSGTVEIVLVDGGNEYYQLRAAPPGLVLVSSVAKRQFRGDDEER